MALLNVTDLYVRFDTRAGVVRAVNGVSFSVAAGETFGIVGESGSGKSVTAYSLMGLLPSPPARIEQGTATLDDHDLLSASTTALRSVRGNALTMIFQDPMTALNPYMRIGKQVAEPLCVHHGVSQKDARSAAIQALQEVGIHDAEKRLDDYPHQFSGGMRQRVMIAMALITQPKLLIADEPTTALDVTVQAQILRLLANLRERHNMAVVLITHDLGVVAETCERVAVMYAGRMLETAPARAALSTPQHPYTRALLRALPSTHVKSHEPLYSIPGLPPDLTQPMAGCPFAPRCEHAVEACRRGDIALREIAPGRSTACRRVVMEGLTP